MWRDGIYKEPVEEDYIMRNPFKRIHSDICPHCKSLDTWASTGFSPTLRFCRGCGLRWGGDGGNIIDPGFLPQTGKPIYIAKLERIKSDTSMFS